MSTSTTKPPSPVPLDALWGKADLEVGPEPHPVLLHILDVAAVAWELVDGRRLPSRLSDDLLAVLPLTDLAFAIALHDLGKLTPGFQAKVPRLKDRLAGLGADFPHNAETNHALATAALLPGMLVAMGASSGCAQLITAVVAGHHGSFHPLSPASNAVLHGGAFWQAARAQAVATLCELLGATPGVWPRRPPEAWLMEVAGLTVLADWIGSDTRFFPYAPGTAATPAYFEDSRARARHALDSLGFAPLPSTTPATFFELFDLAPRPMQAEVAKAVHAMAGPGLLIVESPTGGGKTEAALYAAENMMARFGLGGAYVALPTQATSNQMFGRVRDYLSQSLERRNIPRINLQLLHGSRDLVSTYDDLRRAAFSPSSIDGSSRTEGAVVAESWFAGKKRGLLAPFAVGTVDQALMAALRGRHYFLRLLGLARKVVIIDEVHAYDAFMSRILDRLLVWLRTLGSSVVLLSATLPAPRLAELIAAWQGEASTTPSEAVPYPRVVTCTDSVTSYAMPRDPSSKREVRLVAIRTPGEGPQLLARQLLDAVPSGVAAWIHNTVGEAQAAYAALREAGLDTDECILFHARFPLEERLALETRLLGALDKGATRPHRLVVVATQVIEQSLDIDFDLMVTALAPIDLLVQRAGRLHRHASRNPSRPGPLKSPTLWVVGRPEGARPDDFGPSGHVYEPHILMRTEKALEGRSSWTLPDEADALMSEVYPALSQLPQVPAGLDDTRAAAWRSTAKDLVAALKAAQQKGGQHLVPHPVDSDYESFLDDQQGPELYDPEESPDKHPAVLARTRDMEPTVTLICLLAGSTGAPQLNPTSSVAIDLDAEPSADLTRALLNRGVTVQHRGVVRAATSMPSPAGWLRSAALRHTRPVVFGADGRAELNGIRLVLDPERGLSIERNTQKESV